MRKILIIDTILMGIVLLFLGICLINPVVYDYIDEIGEFYYFFTDTIIFFNISFYFIMPIYYYLFLKSIVSIILFIDNLYIRNIIIDIRKLLLYIPSVVMILFVISVLIYSTINNYIRKRFIIDLIILSIGIISWLSYWLLNIKIKISSKFKILFAIVQPIGFMTTYLIVWFLMQFDNFDDEIMWFYRILIEIYGNNYAKNI